MPFIAHRGESADAPENTMAAFRLAWQRGVGDVELDVHLTADGALIVCHDPDTGRTTGAARRIAESTAAELQALDAGRWRGPVWEGERLPLLADVLAAMPAGGRCFVELKSGPGAVPALAQVLGRAGAGAGQVVAISFSADAVAEVRRRLPAVETLLLAGFRRDAGSRAWSPPLEALIARARAAGAHGLDLAAEGPIDRASVGAVHAAGLSLAVWTVDDPAVARRLLADGVDAITSNRAAWLREQCAGSEPE